jgi:hypothetical protein
MAADSHAVEQTPDGPTWGRLQDQISWYDRKSMDAQLAYKRLKVLQLLAAAAVPVVAALEGASWVIAALGALVLVLEGLQQLGQYQANWIAYRSTCEALRHEKYLFLASAGPYIDPELASRTLAERLEGLVSQEHAKWAAAREESEAPPTRHQTNTPQ